MQIVKRESQKLALRMFCFMSLLLRQEAMQLYEHAALLSKKQHQISIGLNHHIIYSNIDPGSILVHFSSIHPACLVPCHQGM